MHILFRTTPSICLPYSGQRMHAVLFQSHLLTIATEQIHVIVIALVDKSHSGNQIDRAGNTHKNRLTRNYIPCLWQNWEVKNHTLSSGTSLYRPNKEVSPGACWLIHKKQVTFLMFTKRSLFLFFLMFSKRSVFSFKVAYEQALYLGQSREVTRKQHAKLMMRVREAAGSLRSP